ncbi:hypothetical protein SDJN02_19589, partial [Cucurbita argyrosperma subsp. argyrosperma]
MLNSILNLSIFSVLVFAIVIAFVVAFLYGNANICLAVKKEKEQDNVGIHCFFGSSRKLMKI